VKTTNKIGELRIVTVNWNQPVLTNKCIKSFIRDGVPERHIIIVDNGSTDNSVSFLQKEFPESQFILSECNLGFAGGFNLGLKQALLDKPDYIFMVNNDTEIDIGMMERLLSGSIKIDADISSPAVFYAQEPKGLWSAGGYFKKFLCAPIDAHRRTKALPQEPVKRDFLTGCALLIKNKVFDTIGFFDEQFFLYYEDLDFIMRAHNAGFDLWLIPDAKLYHFVSASSNNSHSENVYYWMARSSWLYYQKHAKAWQWVFIIPWRIGHGIKTIAKLLIQRNFRAIKAFLSGFLHLNPDKYEIHFSK